MNDIELNMYLKYPALNRANKKKTEYKGIIEYKPGKCAFVVFHVPNYPSAKDVTYEVRTHFTATEEQVLKTQAENLNFFEFVELFKTLLSAQPTAVFNESRFQVFCNEYIALKTLHPDHKFILDKDVTYLEIIYKDDRLFSHHIKVKVDFCNKRTPLYTVVSHSLPEEKTKELFSSEKSLKYIHKKFINYVHDLEIFFDRCNKIDDFCWVIDPQNPTTKHIWRRIVIEEGVSIQVTFNPWDATARPDIKFFGPTRLTDKYLHNVIENIEDWDPEYDIAQSILRLLDLPFFPIKPEELAKTNENEECCMCNEKHLNEKLPDIVCENTSCESCFHTECLYQWLSSIPNRKIVNKIQGECPICEKMISCEKPE